MKPTPRAKFSYNARTYSTSNKETVSISSLVNADITLKVLYEAHGQGLEKDDKAILAATLRTSATVTTKLESLLMKHQRPAGNAGIPRVGADMKREAAKCASCAKKFALLARPTNCMTCGYISCGKCISHRQVPRSFGYDESSTVKVCTLCSAWFKDFLNAQFDLHIRPRLNDAPPPPPPPPDTPSSDVLPATIDQFLAAVDVATDDGHLSPSVKDEISAAAIGPRLTVTTAGIIMSILKHVLATIVAHYEYHDDMDSNDSEGNDVATPLLSASSMPPPPMLSLSDDTTPFFVSRKSTRHLPSNVQADKTSSGVPDLAIRSILSLMVLLDSIPTHEHVPLSVVGNSNSHDDIDDDDVEALVHLSTPDVDPYDQVDEDDMTAAGRRHATDPDIQDIPPVEELLEEDDRDTTASSLSENPNLLLPTTSYYVTLFRKASDRYRLTVNPTLGLVHVTSIVRGSTFSFRFPDVHVQAGAVGSDAVRLCFVHRSDVVYQFASDAVKAEFCSVVDAYKRAHPHVEPRRLPLVPLLKGERRMHLSRFPATAALMDCHVRGIVMVTNYRLLFLPLEAHGPTLVEIPLFAIVAVSRAGGGVGTGFTKDPAACRLQGTSALAVTCKDVRALRLDVADDKAETLQTLVNRLAECTQRHTPVHLVGCSSMAEGSGGDIPHFAFLYIMSHVPVDGWQFAHLATEYERLGLNDDTHFQWIDNDNGDVCDSYPPTLVVPASLSQSSIESAAGFRAKGRLPVVTWLHPVHKSILARSSQPLLGRLLSGASCNMDEGIVNCYRQRPGPSKPFYIFDARKSKAAAGNRLMGKGGVETSENYEGAIIYHLNIANMYKMQASYQAMVKICIMPEYDKTWWSAVEATRWFEHLHLVLDGACRIARVLEVEGASALVHCSDGWDRTCQLVCLAQIMLDPHYRTLHGFATLVEKDWCLFGHKFMERLGGNRGKDPMRAKMSPIFFQFLDAVFQMLSQFPNAFEFNEHCLLHLANALTSGLYGTFVYDSYQQRKLAGVASRTVSVWTPLCAAASFFLNPDYTPVVGPLWVWTGHQALKLWTNYFLQHHELQTTRVAGKSLTPSASLTSALDTLSTHEPSPEE